jgi:hypothetical protein
MQDSIGRIAQARRSSGVMHKTLPRKTWPHKSWPRKIWPAIAIALGLTLAIVRAFLLAYELIKDNLGQSARERTGWRP